MGIITPIEFSEGDLSSASNFDSIDSSWNGVSKTLNGLNVREEGLDRRVILNDCWMGTNASQSNYYASNKVQMAFPGGSGADGSFHTVHPIPGSVGGVGTGAPDVRQTWKRDETQAIMVRASFKVTWNTSKIMTSGTASVDNAAATPLWIWLVRYNNRHPADVGAPDQFAWDNAVFGLSLTFGSSQAQTGPVSNIEHAYDRRSNLYGSTTLCDLVTPGDIWEHTGTGSSDITFGWFLAYWTPLASGATTPGSTHIAYPEISDINMYATAFNK